MEPDNEITLNEVIELLRSMENELKMLRNFQKKINKLRKASHKDFKNVIGDIPDEYVTRLQIALNVIITSS